MTVYEGDWDSATPLLGIALLPPTPLGCPRYVHRYNCEHTCAVSDDYHCSMESKACCTTLALPMDFDCQKVL